MSRQIRITVRGSFDDLSAQQLAELVAEREQHDFLRTEYTADGYLAYDLPARPFYTFRFADEVDDEAAVSAAVVRAQEKAAAWMTARGYATKNVTAQAVDMSEVPLGKRGRREADRKAAR
jgi:Family of unknown function (DUF6204)